MVVGDQPGQLLLPLSQVGGGGGGVSETALSKFLFASEKMWKKVWANSKLHPQFY